METTASPRTRRIDKLFGGFRMTWPRVIIFAVATALLTAVMLILPITKNTSFRNTGTLFESWVLFAVFIMSNCKGPLDSACKTFVFFLVSQPLIYLFQVPFSEMGFDLFKYYPYWFVFTLATFPAAFVGWYITKRNWLSLLILLPVIVLLTMLGGGFAKDAIQFFPRNLLSAVFCFAQIILYLWVFCRGIAMRLCGLGITAVCLTVIFLNASAVEMSVSDYLEGVPTLSEQAEISFSDPSIGTVTITRREAPPYIHIMATRQGTTDMTLRDGDKTYHYTVEVKPQDGTVRVIITPKDTPQDTSNDAN